MAEEYQNPRQGKPLRPKFSVELCSGAIAGGTVDLALFPIDTVKTRLQSELGFLKAGGFRRLYGGAPSVLIGGAPGAALFFSTYEFIKSRRHLFTTSDTVAEMAAASCGEVVACLVRVPTEIVKQRTQAALGRTTRMVLIKLLHDDGFRGLYRGYRTTVLREIPFSFIQFPLWEAGKRQVATVRGRPTTTPAESAVCGSLAGMLAAAVTTPLDVAKTRIMLAERLYGGRERARDVWRSILEVEGWRGLFAGVQPRVVWMGLGGFVFLGAYDLAKQLLTPLTAAEVTKVESEPTKRTGSSLLVFLGNLFVVGNNWFSILVQPYYERRLVPFDKAIEESLPKLFEEREEQRRFLEEWKNATLPPETK